MAIFIDTMKYIIVKTDSKEIPYIFPNAIQHIDFACNIMAKNNLTGKVIGAGFVTINDKKLECFSRSISLNVKSRAIDSDIINKEFNQKVFAKIDKLDPEKVFDFY